MILNIYIEDKSISNYYFNNILHKDIGFSNINLFFFIFVICVIFSIDYDTLYNVI